MSDLDNPILSDEKIEYDVRVAPIANISKNSFIDVQTGVQSVDYKAFPATTGTSSTMINFQLQMNDRAVLDPDVKIRYRGRLTLPLTKTGAVATANPFLSKNYYCKRPFALQHNTNTSEVRPNGQSIITQNDRTVSLIQQYIDCSSDNPLFSDDAHDTVQRFSNLYPTAITAEADGIIPFGNVQYHESSKYKPRTSKITYVIEAANANFDAAGQYDLHFEVEDDELIMCDLFTYGRKASGLSGIKTFGYTMNMNNKWIKFLQIAGNLPANVTAGTPTFEFLDTPDILIRQVQLHDHDYQALMNSNGFVEEVYSLSNHAIAHETRHNVLTGLTFDYNSQPLTVPGIPEHVYFGAMRVFDNTMNDGAAVQTVVAALQTPSVYALPLSATLSFNGNDVFKMTSTKDLYNLSVKNGIKNMSYDTWLRAGGVVCINIANDCGLLNALNIVNNLTNSQLKLSVTYKNVDTAAHSYDVYTSVQTTSYLSLSTNGTSALSSSLNLQSNDMSKVMAHPIEARRIRGQSRGGGFFDVVKKIGSTVSSIANAAAPVVNLVKAFSGGLNLQANSTGGKSGGCSASEPVNIPQVNYPSLNVRPHAINNKSKVGAGVLDQPKTGSRLK